jgi:hypothetical protein
VAIPSEPESVIEAEPVVLSQDKVTEEKEEIERINEEANIEVSTSDPEPVIEAEPLVLSEDEIHDEKEEIELIEEEAKIETSTSEPEPEMEPASPRDTRTVETLEKWLNNASRMMKG